MPKERVIILIAAVVALAGFVYWYFIMREAPVLPPVETPQGEEPASLGAQILEKAQNPFKDQIPELGQTVNPIEGLYKNPFE